MSHEIDTMAYVGEKPWHGLGVKMDKVMTSAEAIKAAGLDWEVKKFPVFAQLDAEKAVELPWKMATVRTDKMLPIGDVGQAYTPVQNREAFSFFDAVVGVKEAMYHTAGSLLGGERVWILAKLPGYVKTAKDDVSEKFLLLVNTHDGSRAMYMMFTPIRVVCQNTLNAAAGGSEIKAWVRHTKNVGTKMDEVRSKIGVINAKFSLFEELSRKMAVTAITAQAWKDYLQHLELAPTGKEDDTARRRATSDTLNELFEKGPGAELKSAKGTVWGAFNAVAAYTDHVRGSDPEKKAISLLFGSGAWLKQAGWERALELCGVKAG
jgi:phage/plasmid-like protein (TIGR03299 family)